MSFLIDLDPLGVKMYKLGSFQFYLDIERCQTLKFLKEPLTTLTLFLDTFKGQHRIKMC